MNETLIIEGKQYISSRRAAEIAGYSNDYVGQLCRAGKLACKMIGRIWYVEEESVLRHREGQQFISSREAAKASGYSTDYIGQLCRSGKLNCRMVGRSWYVDEQSLQKHKSESLKPNQTVFKKEDFLPKDAAVAGDADRSGLPSFVMSPSKMKLVSVVTAVVLVFGVIAVDVREPGLFNEGIDATASVVTAARSFEQTLSAGWGTLTSAVASLFPGSGLSQPTAGRSPDEENVVQEPPASSVIPPLETGKVTAEHGGLVVLPFGATSTDENKLEASIENSFSDQVMVRPNPDDTSGVIQPVFRSTAGHDFLYVLVPVKATTTHASH